MVESIYFWEQGLAKAIKATKRRIIHGEKHGLGTFTMEEKRRLVKQQRMMELRKQK